MRVLVGCEFSGVIRDAFLNRGHDAISCDLLPSEAGPPHIIGDIREVLSESQWDLFIAHPPCTYLSVVGNRHLKQPGRLEKREQALEFFVSLWSSPIHRICIENPVGYVNTHFVRPDQIIHPYMFGEAVRKRTCLWLLNLPKLVPTNPVDPPEPWFYSLGDKTRGKPIHYVEGGTKSAHERSRSFQGIADAMANQWGSL